MSTSVLYRISFVFFLFCLESFCHDDFVIFIRHTVLVYYSIIFHIDDQLVGWMLDVGIYRYGYIA